VKVSFKESIDEDILHRLPVVRSVTRIDTNNWQLATENPELLRKQILELALQHNLNIVSLHSENQSLEEVFRSLTSQKN
jgi:ABC-2 type transport system ATP-binding protein